MKLLPHSPIPVYPLTGHLDSLSGLGLKAILDRRDDLKLPLQSARQSGDLSNGHHPTFHWRDIVSHFGDMDLKS